MNFRQITISSIHVFANNTHSQQPYFNVTKGIIQNVKVYRNRRAVSLKTY